MGFSAAGQRSLRPSLSATGWCRCAFPRFHAALLAAFGGGAAALLACFTDGAALLATLGLHVLALGLMLGTLLDF